jgi:hypothetical protein
MGVREFRAITVTPAALRGDGAGFMAGGQFIVRAKFDPGDCARYEYRQYIKGTASTTQGTFGGATPSRTSWRATAAPHNAGPDFQVPGGLTTTYKEDGQVIGSRTERFGHRNHSQVLRTGIEDRYLPNRADGCEYKARDTWGLRGTARPRGLRVKIDIIYRGRIIDTEDSNRVVRSLHWGVHIDDIIT